MTTANLRELENEIERLVREHVAACEQAATAAVTRAFGAARSGRPGSKRARSTRSKSRAPRRTPEQVAEFGERFYAAVCASPGETMRVLSVEVGAAVKDLHRPVRMLKQAGRVRSAGQRQHMRYFPMASEMTETS